jgi:hypothetical protein
VGAKPAQVLQREREMHGEITAGDLQNASETPASAPILGVKPSRLLTGRATSIKTRSTVSASILPSRTT